MALNHNIIGKPIETAPFRYGPDQAILYALGIGAGPDEIDFIYEKKLKVYPTFAVVPFLPAFFGTFIQKANINLASVLHGEHKIIFHKPIPPAETLKSTLYCESIYDKGDKGAVLHVRGESHTEDGELLFVNRAVVFDRTAGNFGGDRGPEIKKSDLPANKAPDFKVTHTSSSNQAALYRLSGDKNPLHIDTDFAKKLGFDRPILHGLCTFGYAGRAILEAVCDNDPGHLKSLSGRFMHPVFPGDTLITEGWKVDAGKYIIRTSNDEGAPVLGNAVAEVSSV